MTTPRIAGIRKPLEEAHWLPAEVYTDPALWPIERECIFRREWLVVGRADRLAQAGDFLTCEIAGARLLVVHGADGTIRAFHNVCRHRGMWVAEGCGRARRFVCPYHLWTYDLQGRLIAAPEMEHASGFDISTIGLTPVRCETWQGFVAINLDDEAGPFSSALVELAELVAPWKLDAMTTVHEKAYPISWD